MTRQPIISSYLAQIFVRHFEMEPEVAVAVSQKLEDALEAYGMQVIIGEWTMPEEVVVEKQVQKSAWDRAVEKLKDAEAAGWAPWKPELPN